jgi:hypothetical protein
MKKLQYLLIKELINNGTVELVLPDGITLEIGIKQKDKHGDFKKVKDYCYVAASRNDKSILLDAYNLGLSFKDEKDTLIFEDSDLDDNGSMVRSMNVV